MKDEYEGGAFVVVGVRESRSHGKGRQGDDQFWLTEESGHGRDTPERQGLDTQRTDKTVSVESGSNLISPELLESRMRNERRMSGSVREHGETPVCKHWKAPVFYSTI